QHVFSFFFRHFTTYCRNRMGTSSLMERFLQDVLQHFFFRYHDNRPTYDFFLLPVTLEAARIACFFLEEVEKKRNRDRHFFFSKDQESVGEIRSSAPCPSHEDAKKTYVFFLFIQKLERGQEHVFFLSQQSMGICSNENFFFLKDAQIANHSHDFFFTAVSPAPQHFSVFFLIRSASVN
ncbi:ZDBF2 protein, partial [Herpetotheres cachinnans]|nr:ZDBF2 protein [Herpetotheres cachinnans]